MSDKENGAQISSNCVSQLLRSAVILQARIKGLHKKRAHGNENVYKPLAHSNAHSKLSMIAICLKYLSLSYWYSTQLNQFLLLIGILNAFFSYKGREKACHT